MHGDKVSTIRYLNPVRGLRGLEPIPAVTGRKAGYTDSLTQNSHEQILSTRISSYLKKKGIDYWTWGMERWGLGVILIVTRCDGREIEPTCLLSKPWALSATVSHAKFCFPLSTTSWYFCLHLMIEEMIYMLCQANGFKLYFQSWQ